MVSFLQPQWKNTGLNKERFDQIVSYFVGKSVLDVGCAVGYKKDNWMHQMIREIAEKCKGIDIDQVSVKEIQEKGFDVIEGNASSFSLDEKFDVIHAGELIEHLDNFNGFLESCKKHLRQDGKLILTTPNAHGFTYFLYAVTGGLRVNDEHTCWFCKHTLSTLLVRMGFKVEKIDYIKHSPKTGIRKVFSSLIRSVLPKDTRWNTLLVVASVK